MADVKNHASSSKAPQSHGRKTRMKGKPQVRVRSNQAKRNEQEGELNQLREAVENFVPTSKLELFTELPLSKRTLKGLKSSHFLSPTPIQALSIPSSLRALDILGSAKTGSGKTLAFLIPLLERLYLLKWGPLDGLGAVVISPTRELAVQTFNQLREIGKYHSFSAGLVIGGKPLKEEQERLGRMNILIATPGRLLQHLDSTVGFESAGVKVLVLDEADRLLDLGFLPALRAIVQHFPVGSAGPDGRPDRQTLLFSATQSKDLAALAKLSLHNPLYINCNKPGEEGVVPAGLEQYYAVVGLEKKLDALWGFVKSHLKMKGVVFVTSGKQVRFVYETFRRLHPGLPLLHLHGKQKQTTRLTTFEKFSSSKASLLICTDVAARGLDFPAVDWVIQLDCPEDVDTYIHRVGRTARYQAEGKALLFLCPSEEEGMLQRWGEKEIEVKKIKIKSSKMGNLKQQMQSFAFREPEIKYLGQRAFISYMRSIHIQKDKTIFDLAALPAEEFAASMGLPGAPQIKFAEKGKGRGAKGRTGGIGAAPEPANTKAQEILDVVGSDESDGEDEDEDEEDGDGALDEDEVISGSDGGDVSDDQDVVGEEEPGSTEDLPKSTAVRTKYDRMFERKNQSILAPHYSALVSHEEPSDEEDDVFTLSRRDHKLDDEDVGSDDELLVETRAQPAEGDSTPLISSEDLSKRKLKSATTVKSRLKSRPAPTKLVFDDTGAARDFYEHGADAELGAGDVEARKTFLAEERERMRVADKEDRAIAKERKREKKRRRKERERGEEESGSGSGSDGEGGGGGRVAVLGGGDYSDDGGYAGSDWAAEYQQQAKAKEEEEERPKRKHKHEHVAGAGAGVEDEEALALRLLQG